MILKQLTIENIFSLKGKHVIPFAKLQKESSLLAITGRTGAGKSTILNCISLALYGKTTLDLTQAEFTSLGEKKAAIKLIFELRGQEYCCSWQVSGKTVKRKLEFANTIIDRGVTDFIKELLKLDLSQFGQTVILNQGKFADFITSSFTHRKEILTTLANLGSLKGLGKELAKQIKQLKQQIIQRQQGIEHSNLLSPEMEQEITEQVEEHKQQLANITEELKQLTLLYQTYQLIAQNNKRFLQTIKRQQECNHKLQQLEQKQHSTKQQLKPLKEKLQKYQKEFENLRPKLKLANQLEQDINAKRSVYDEQQKNFEHLISAKQQLTIQIEQNSQQLITIKQLQNYFVTNNCQSSPQITLKQLSQMQSTIHQLEVVFTQHDGLLKQIQNIQQEIEQLTQKITQIKSKLEQYVFQFKLSSSQQLTLYLQEELQQLQIAQQRLQQEIGAKRDQQQSYQIMLQQLNTVQQTTTDYQQQLSSTEQKITTLSLQLKNIDLELQNFQQQEQLNKLLSATQLLRQENTQRKTCIVCNAPLTTTPPSPDAQAAIELDPQQYQTLKEQRTHLQQQFDTLQAQQQVFHKELQQLQDQQESLTKNTQNLNTIDQQVNHLLAQQQELEKRYQQLFQHQQDINYLLRQLHDQQTLLDKKQNDLTLQQSDEQTIVATIEQYAHLILSTLQLHGNIDLRPLLPAIEEYLQHYHQHLSLQQTLDELQEIAQQKQEEYVTLKKEQEERLSAISRQQQELERLLGEQWNLGVLTIQQQWEDKLSTTQHLLTKQQKDLEEQERDRHTILGQLDNLALQQQQLITDSQQQLALTDKLHFNDEKLQALLTYKDKIYLLLQNPQEREQQEFELLIQDRIELPLHKLQQSQQQLNDLNIQLQERLTINEQHKHKIANLQHEITVLGQALNTKEALFSIIGTDEFRNYMLSIIEQDLIIRANQELENLCEGRYRVLLRDTQLYIIDSGHQAMERKIASLSGGEKFMVSLAFALALSEMTRGLAQIDSFFIDEGFGSLDEQSLSEVLSMLYSVQARGKNIILISHQKELFQRIPINIHVEKQSDDFSNISIIYN